MSQNAHVNLVGQTTTTGLHLDTILRRGTDRLPVYSATCTRCKTSGIGVPHRKVQQKSAQCPRCGRTEASDSTGATMARVETSYLPNSARSQADKAAFEQAEKAAPSPARQRLLEYSDRYAKFLKGEGPAPVW